MQHHNTLPVNHFDRFALLTLSLTGSEDESPWKVQTRLKQRFNNVLDSLNRNVNVMDNLNSIGKAIEPGIGSEEEDDETCKM